MGILVLRSSSTGGGGGGGGPGFTESVLDNFASMRTTGGHDLWENYGGEGASATTSITTAASRFGTGNGLRYSLSGGETYLHFYCNDGSSWAYAKAYATGYTEDTFNRMSMWIRHPSNMPAEGPNQNNVEFGTYTRALTGDTATQNDGGDHFYHYYDLLPGVWSKVIVENHPQHSVGGGSSDPGVQTSPTTSGSTFPYFDAMTRFYWNCAGSPPSSYPANFDFSDIKFYNDTNANEDTTNVMSLVSSYNPTTDLLNIGFCRSTGAGADTTYTARWSPNDMHVNGFSSGTLLGTTTADGQGDYVNKRVQGTVAALESTYSGIYIAVQKQGETTFRQTYHELTGL